MFALKTISVATTSERTETTEQSTTGFISIEKVYCWSFGAAAKVSKQIIYANCVDSMGQKAIKFHGIRCEMGHSEKSCQ